MLSLNRPTLLLEAAQEAARVAGWAALRRYRKALDVESKADGSPVTIADREAEAAVRAWIGRCFPDDGIEGEELGIVRPDASRRWLVDPIDGTRTFVRGVPLWGAVIAVVEHDQVLAGAAFFPAIDETIAAAPGEGTWWNGSRCIVSSVNQLDRATILTTDERFRDNDLKRADWNRLSERAEIDDSFPIRVRLLVVVLALVTEGMVLPDRPALVEFGSPHLHDLLGPTAAQPLQQDHGPNRIGHQGEYHLDVRGGDGLDSSFLPSL